MVLEYEFSLNTASATISSPERSQTVGNEAVPIDPDCTSWKGSSSLWGVPGAALLCRARAQVPPVFLHLSYLFLVFSPLLLEKLVNQQFLSVLFLEKIIVA